MKKLSKIGVMLCIGILILTLLPVVGIGCAGAPAPAEAKHLTIGIIEPLSGPISIVGVSQARGYELYYDKLNKQGGLKIGNETYRIDCIVEDSKSDPEATGNAANKLINENGAKFIFGEIIGPCTSAIYQYTLPAKALQLITSMSAIPDPADVGPDKPLLVRPAINMNYSDMPIVDYIRKAYPTAKTIAISAPNIGYEGMIDNLTSYASKQGMQVVHVEKWDWGITDFIPVYTKVLASKPDVAWCMISGQSQDQLRAARDLGYKGVFVDDSPTDPDILVRVAGAAACTDVISAGMDIGSPTDAMKEVMAMAQEKYNEPFNSSICFTWDGAWILTQVMEKAQSIDPEKVFETFETMTAPGSLKTVFGSGRIGGLKTFGVNRVLARPIPVVHLMDGKQELQGLFFVDVE